MHGVSTCWHLDSGSGWLASPSCCQKRSCFTVPNFLTTPPKAFGTGDKEARLPFRWSKHLLFCTVRSYLEIRNGIKLSWLGTHSRPAFYSLVVQGSGLMVGLNSMMKQVTLTWRVNERTSHLFCTRKYGVRYSYYHGTLTVNMCTLAFGLRFVLRVNMCTSCVVNPVIFFRSFPVFLLV